MNASPIDLTPVSDADIDWICDVMQLSDLDQPRVDFLKSTETLDVAACPGSGKTTLLVAKLAILARHWTDLARGMCVLSHTNVAKDEIQARLSGTDVGARLLAYPHFIDTIHSFASRFITRPDLLSKGIRLQTVDDDITHAARRRAVSTSERQTLEAFLHRKHRSMSDLRVATTNAIPTLGFQPLGAGEGKPSYEVAKKALLASLESGYLCYDEVISLANSALGENAYLRAAIACRFPVILIDEMQDTSSRQEEFLSAAFGDGTEMLIQRVGDPNQAVFSESSGKATSSFPDPNREQLTLASSYRFDQSIASLANPLAYQAIEPSGLIGTRTVGDVNLKHTIFLFPDDEPSGVLPAFGDHVLSQLDSELLSRTKVAAVASVHRPPDNENNFPRSLTQYWDGYVHRPPSRFRVPATLAEHVQLAQSLVNADGNTFEAIECLSWGVRRLIGQLEVGKAESQSARNHQRLLEEFDAEGRRQYQALAQRLLLADTVITEEKWGLAVQALKIILRPVVVEFESSSCEFLDWSSALPEPAPNAYGIANPNVYIHVGDSGGVDIHLSSIHSVKGETHSATLVLETFYYEHLLRSSVLKDRSTQGPPAGRTEKYFHNFVAMTRPSHLLCLAMPESWVGTDSNGIALRHRLQGRGWSLRSVQ